jgi:hypothetical protein
MPFRSQPASPLETYFGVLVTQHSVPAITSGGARKPHHAGTLTRWVHPSGPQDIKRHSDHSGENPADHVAVHVGETAVDPVVSGGELGVIDAKQM